VGAFVAASALSWVLALDSASGLCSPCCGGGSQCKFQLHLQGGGDLFAVECGPVLVAVYQRVNGSVRHVRSSGGGSDSISLNGVRKRGL